MKKIVLALTVLVLLSSGLSTKVYAEEEIPTSIPIIVEEKSEVPILKDVQIINDGGVNQIIRIYDVPLSYDVTLLGDKSFEKNGTHYEKGDVLLISENAEHYTKLAGQTMTASHQTKETGLLFMPLLDYSMDGYTGQLKLDTSSIFTEAAGKQSYSYTVNDTKEFKSLERNDTFYIPKTSSKNGVSLSLENVDWIPMGDGRYNAVAEYSGSASGSKVTGYTSTATYIGEVAKTEVLGATYKVIYEGKAIPPLAPSILPWIFSGIAFILLIVAFAMLFKYRRNTKIYALIGGRYSVVKRIRLTYLNPIVSLAESSLRVQSEEYIINIDRFAVRELHGQFVQIFLENGDTIHRCIINEGHDIKLQINAVLPERDLDMDSSD